MGAPGEPTRLPYEDEDAYQARLAKWHADRQSKNTIAVRASLPEGQKWESGQATPTGTRATTPIRATAPAPAPPAQPGILDKPGYGENFYTDNKNKWSQPSKTSTYYDSTKSYYSTPVPKPTTTTSAYQKYMSDMSDPGRGTERAYNISDQLNKPTQGEVDLRSFAGQLNAPGSGEKYYGDTKDFYGRSGAGENYIDASLGEFGAPGVAETNYDDILGDYEHFVSDLRGPSDSELLYSSGQGEDGLTTYFSREREKSQRALDDAMAARGLFGGEAALRGTIELNSDIAAKQAKEMAAMAAQADAARLGRTGEARQYGGLKTSAADLAQRSKEGRVQSGIDNSVTLQGLETDRIGKGQTAANSAQAAELARILGGGDLSNKAANTEIDRLSTAGNLGISADDTEQARLNDLLKGAIDVDGVNLAYDRFGLDKIKAGQSAAGDVDEMMLRYLDSEGAAAGRAQNLGESRERGALNDIAGVTGSMTDDYSDQANKIVSDWMDAEEQKIQAALDSGQITQEGANARRQANQQQGETMMRLLSEGVQTYAKTRQGGS